MVSKKRRRRGDLAPNPAIWQALRGGPGLNDILNDFYGRVYQDPRLFPFFDGVTQERAVEKQFNFLYQMFTGERVYFGERPRNAHNWMVISDELYDYREELMEACLRRYGLDETLIAEWRAMEEVFRKQIVKSEPQPKKMHGYTLPVEGYDTLRLEIGSLCDGCEAAMDTGTEVVYHVRTGKTYCPTCALSRTAPSQL